VWGPLKAGPGLGVRVLPKRPTLVTKEEKKKATSRPLPISYRRTGFEINAEERRLVPHFALVCNNVSGVYVHASGMKFHLESMPVG